MPNGTRIHVAGEGDKERFTVFVFPDSEEARNDPHHTMSSYGPMTEAEFRKDLAARGAGQDLIESTIAEARSHKRL